ncbi:MAG: RNA polymerase sigma factor [Bacteroidetes bacterium]|nr:MAG: RNA polymerase sigma factor [Bacteroidota bacterium]
MQTMVHPETALINGLRSGETAAYEELVRVFQEKVLNTSLGFLPRMEDAEDITQEVFLEVFRSVGAFKEGARLSTWIYRITVNKCLEALRRRKRHKRYAFFQALVGLEDDRAQALPDQLNHPGIQLEQQERARVLYQAMDRLPEKQRAAFILHKVEGLSHREIGAALDINIPAVESLVHRARKNLQKTLTTYYKNDQI